MDRQRIDRRLRVFRDVPLVIDDRDAVEPTAERDETLAQVRQHVGKHAHVGARAAIDLMEEGDRGLPRAPARAAEGDAHLAEIVALLLVMAARRERGARVGGGEEGEEVRRVVEDRVDGQRKVRKHARDERRLDRGQGRDGDAMHLIPEVLARQPRDVDAGEVAQRRRGRPPSEPPLARRVTGAPDGGERQRLTDGEAIVLRGPGARRQVRVDHRRQIEGLRELPGGGDGTMRVGRQREGLRVRQRL